MKKQLLTLAAALTVTSGAMAQGWPSAYQGVMLQGFYWDSFDDTQWTKLESQADDLASSFSLIWVPQSGKCLEQWNMGYTPYYYFNQNSNFGTEAELRSMIQTFKAKGLGTVADVVVNHHNTNGWTSFPAETYNGVTYQFKSTDIVADDDAGKTQKANPSVQLSSNNDEGEGWDGCRDLDHKSENVQTIIKAYVKYLKDDLGYTGFRYDMVKGFSGTRVADYNDAAGIEFSVGECWDNISTITSWLNTAGKKSAAFDFPFRYTVRDAANNGNWTSLAGSSVMKNSLWRRYAVTFVENHDTEYRSASAQQDPIKKDTLAANAYLLAMPGTPCVFLKHWQAYQSEIAAMISMRKLAGITNESAYTQLLSTKGAYSVKVTGTNGELVAIVGTDAASQSAPAGFVKALEGYHYAYYISNTLDVATIDKASGEYEGSVTVTLNAATTDASAQLVYTTDGTTPSATNGTRVAPGTELTLTSATTLSVGILKDGAVQGIVTRSYTLAEPFEPTTISVYVNADEAGSAWSAAYTTAASPRLNFWTWNDSNNLHGTTKGSWPGDAVTTLATVDGIQWFVQEHTLHTKADYVSFVWSVGSGSPQTVNVEKVQQTSFYKITSSRDGSNYKVDDVTAQHTTGIAPVIATDSRTSRPGVWTLSGQRLSATNTSTLPSGLYIINGRKVMVK